MLFLHPWADHFLYRVANMRGLQHAATHCNTLQHRERGYRYLFWRERMCGLGSHAAWRERDIQHAATRCITLQHAATHCNTLQHTATHCNIQNCTNDEDVSCGGRGCVLGGHVGAWVLLCAAAKGVGVVCLARARVFCCT